MTRNFIVLLGSDPKFGKGGAARVVTSYQDYYRRNDIPCFFRPFHRMYKRRLFRPLPIFSLFRYSLTLFNVDNYFVHHHHTSLFDLLWLKIFCLFSRTPRARVIITFHNPKHFLGPVTTFRKAHFAVCTTAAASLHFLNSRDMDLFESCRVVGYQFRKSVCPNPLEDSLFNLCKSSLSRTESNRVLTSVSNSEFVIGILSVLRFGKRIDLTIKMLALLPSCFKLKVAGTGEALSSLQALSRELNLTSRVEFLGWISDTEKASFFESISIFVNSSEFDCQPLVVVESIAFSTPVISVPNSIFLENYPQSTCVNYADCSSPASLACVIKQFDFKCFDPSEPIRHLLASEERLNFLPQSFK